VSASRNYVAGLRRQDWAFFAMMFCAGGTFCSLLLGDPAWIPLGYAVGALLAGALARRWSRLYPAPMPHALRWLLPVSHPGLSPRGLHRLLAPRPGERLLEIGPGTGHHALPTARALAPSGRLDVLDLQPEMLRDLERRAARERVENVVASGGDAERLPYPDASFDGAYLVTVLGEIPHPDTALRELARVVKRGGRVVVGELFLDPDYVPPSRMRALAAGAGLAFGAQSGTRLAYFARLDVPGIDGAAGAHFSHERASEREEQTPC
jgi:SAM-dependent methyltransferase